MAVVLVPCPFLFFYRPDPVAARPLIERSVHGLVPSSRAVTRVEVIPTREPTLFCSGDAEGMDG